MGAGAAHSGRGITPRSDAQAARASERPRLAQWQRQSAAVGRRADVPRRRAGGSLAQSDDFICQRQTGAILRRQRGEDDRSIRLGASGLLAAGQHPRRCLGVQHRDQPGRSGAADREYAQDDSCSGHQVATRHSLVLPRCRWTIHPSTRSLQYRAVRSLRCSDDRRGLHDHVAADDL